MPEPRYDTRDTWGRLLDSFLPCNTAFPLTAAFLTQTVCLDDTTVKFEIWDTAGQERYHSLAPMYYRGAQAAIVVYDITNTVKISPFFLTLCSWVGMWADFLCHLGGVSHQNLQGDDILNALALPARASLVNGPGQNASSVSDILALSPQDTFARAKNWVKELQRQASPNIVIALAGNKADLASKRAVEFQVGGWMGLGAGSASSTCSSAWAAPGLCHGPGREVAGELVSAVLSGLEHGPKAVVCLSLFFFVGW